MMWFYIQADVRHRGNKRDNITSYDNSFSEIFTHQILGVIQYKDDILPV